MLLAKVIILAACSFVGVLTDATCYKKLETVENATFADLSGVWTVSATNYEPGVCARIDVHYIPNTATNPLYYSRKENGKFILLQGIVSYKYGYFDVNVPLLDEFRSIAVLDNDPGFKKWFFAASCNATPKMRYLLFVRNTQNAEQYLQEAQTVIAKNNATLQNAYYSTQDCRGNPLPLKQKGKNSSEEDDN